MALLGWFSADIIANLFPALHLGPRRPGESGELLIAQQTAAEKEPNGLVSIHQVSLNCQRIQMLLPSGSQGFVCRVRTHTVSWSPTELTPWSLLEQFQHRLLQNTCTGAPQWVTLASHQTLCNEVPGASFKYPEVSNDPMKKGGMQPFSSQKFLGYCCLELGASCTCLVSIKTSDTLCCRCHFFQDCQWIYNCQIQTLLLRVDLGSSRMSQGKFT